MTRRPPARRSSTCLLGALVALCIPGAARAAVFPAEPIDGPTGELVSVGDVDVARDGTGAVAYVKRDGGVDHVFVARLINGAFTAPERLDAALPAGASQPVVGASDGGRVVVAFVSGGTLYTSLRPTAAAAFGPPQGVANGASNPSVDMSITGAAYVSFTAPGASASDVRVARLARDGGQFVLLDAIVDIDPAREAGDGVRRSHVAISADGTAVITWGEADHVWARRVFGTRLSVAPQDLTVAAVGPLAGGGVADSATVDIEDDSSFAWAVFREAFGDGRVHAVARRLVGSAFEAPALVDGLGVPAGADAAELAVELNGRGEGIAATGAGTAGVFGAILHEDTFFPALPLGGGTAVSHPAVGIAENNDAFAAWLPGDGTTHLRPYDIDPAKRTPPPPGPDAIVSRPELGAVDAAAGMDMGVNRVGDAVAVFVQDGADGKRLVYGTYDRPPGNFRTYTSSRFRPFARPPLSWQGSFDLWGPLTYTVLVDGQPVGQTTATKLTPVNPVPDGVHSWRVIATDRRGQTATAAARGLRVDSLAPQVILSVTGTKRRGKPVKVSARVADGSLRKPAGSGVKLVRIDFGDTGFALTRTAVHRYRRGGRFTVKATATDVAGNVATVVKQITIKKN